MDKRWLVRQVGASRRQRLYCFAYAGGAAGVYGKWQTYFPSDVEVCAIQLPGRGTRLGEAPLRSLSAIIQKVADLIAHEAVMPFSLFGHSLGALLAFEVTQRLRAIGKRMPQRLFVSGCEAAHLFKRKKAFHLLPDDALIEQLRTYNGTPAEVLENRELMELILPMVRADFELVDQYSGYYRAAPPITLPIIALTGRQDPYCEPHRTTCWLDHSTVGGRVHQFDGDHFFIDSSRDAVLACVLTELGYSDTGRARYNPE